MKSLAALLLLLVLLSSCRTKTEYITRYQTHTDTLHRTTIQLRTDTLRDSIHIRTTERAQGDTIYITTTEYRDRIRYRDRTHTDTIYQTRTDTIQASTQTTTTPPQTNWQRFKSRIKDTLLTAALAALAAFALYKYINLK